VEAQARLALEASPASAAGLNLLFGSPI